MKAIRTKLIALIILGLLTIAANGQESRTTPSLRVLFIGNSLTYANDLPAMVKAIAEHNGKKFAYETVAYPDLSLEDHLVRGDAVRLIKAGKWDFVVLQQGSSALPESRMNLIEFTRRFAHEIKRVGAKPAMMMVWTWEDRQFDFDRVHESYELAAKEVDGIFIPAGESWRAAWKEKPELKLYSDRLHPTALGSCLAAAVTYKILFNASSIELPAKIKNRVVTIELSKDQRELVRTAAMGAQ
jgi:hypothetical protein